MAEELSRRRFIGVGSAALAAAAGLQIAEGQENKVPRSPDHHLPNESEPGPNNTTLDKQNPSSVWPPETDAGGQPPFKYSFSLSHKRIEDGGWTRQVTVRDLPVSRKVAGVEMRLISGGIRELHWHPNEDEWQYYVTGKARMTVFAAGGRARTMD
ncbi:MAG: cupin domain-containing protein, partial [Silvibacterium sp.]